MSALPLVSIITVNFNNEKETIALLESLQKVTYSPVEIIVVDNGSVTKPSDALKNFPSIKFIQSEQNLGFSGGNNLGIKEAKGDLILLLNNDTEVEADFLEPLVNKAVSDDSIGLISPKIIFHNRNNTIQYAGCSPIHPITSRGFAIGYGKTDGAEFSVSGFTARAHGAAMLISRKLIDTIGALPEQFFLYYEEMDYAEQAKRAGFKIWFEAKSVVYHKESMSVGKHSTIKAYYMHRNRMLYVRRNVPGIKKLLSMLYLLAVAYPKEVLTYLKKGQFSNALQIGKGILWNVTHSAN